MGGRGDGALESLLFGEEVECALHGFLPPGEFGVDDLLLLTCQQPLLTLLQQEVVDHRRAALLLVLQHLDQVLGILQLEFECSQDDDLLV